MFKGGLIGIGINIFSTRVVGIIKTLVSWFTNTYAVTFNGSSYVRYGNPAKLQLTGDFTCILKVKAGTASPAAVISLIGKYGNITNQRSWVLGQFNSANTYQIFISSNGQVSGTTHKNYTFTVPYCTTWQQIAITYKSGGSGTLKCFVNGVAVTPTKVSDNAVASLFNSSSDFCVGALYDSASPLYFTGSVDDVAVYNRELSESEMLAQYNNGKSVDRSSDSGLVFWGKYENNNNDSSASPATPAVTGSLTYSTVPSTFYTVENTLVNKNLLTATVGIGNKFSPQSDISFTTDTTNLVLTTYTNVYTLNSYWAKLSVWVDGVYLQEITHTANDQVLETVITLSSGTKTIRIVNSGHYYSSGVYYGTWVQRVHVNDATYISDDLNNPEILVLGDSISNGQASTVHTKDSWLALIKAANPNKIFKLYGGSALQFNHIASDATARTALVNAIAPGINSRTQKIFILLGTNDYGNSSWTAANFGTAYAALLVLLNTTYPNLQIVCFTPTYRSTETANGVGNTLDDYRNAIISACSGKAYATSVSLKTTFGAGEMADTVHPNNAGHVLIKTAIQSYV